MSGSPVDPAFVRRQINAVASDLRPHAVKSGMLGTAAVVRAVANAVREHRLTPFVVDPVMVATSGDPLLDDSAITAVRADLTPLADLLTPNLDEVAVLLGVTTPRRSRDVRGGRDDSCVTSARARRS